MRHASAIGAKTDGSISTVTEKRWTENPESQSNTCRACSAASASRPSRERAAVSKARETLKRGLSRTDCSAGMRLIELPHVQVRDRERVIGHEIQRIEWAQPQRTMRLFDRYLYRAHPGQCERA